MKLPVSLLPLLVVCFQNMSAQSGIIKGLIVDEQSEQPIIGANVLLLAEESSLGAITDFDGYYRIGNVPVGRQSVQVSFLGYETIIVPNIVVTSGKDAVINVSLKESFGQLDEVVLTFERRKDKPINTLSTNSIRQFSVDEVQRFSGGRSDVGRLAANFAGVSAPDDSRNDIVVRGNSPTGLLYRLEGIPIPNPNHFTTVGTTGGAVSAINPNLLKNSDFLTSAFPSEYGNALGGVFDLGFRDGNKDDYEFTAQVGAFTGVEALAEGPLGEKNGSFLIGARYSLVGLLGVGAGGTAATPNYSDLSFNINLGKSNLGQFSVFGIFGTSDIDFLGDNIDQDDLFAAEDEDLYVTSCLGVAGLKHRISIGNTSYLETIVSSSFANDAIQSDRYINKDKPDERVILYTETDNTETRFSASTLFNSKLSSQLTLRTGALLEQYNADYLLRDREEQPDNNNDGDPDLFTFIDTEEDYLIAQPYAQVQYRITENLTLNAGAHGQYSDLNEQFVFEPRAGLQYRLDTNNRLSFAYGLHHQPISSPVLFLFEDVDGEFIQTNRDLDFVRSNQYVLGYDLRFASNWRAKLEVYHQDIDNAGVQPFPSSYSTLTEGADFTFDNDKVSLVNKGNGFNQGIELTVEKFFSDGYYGLFTGSLFESKYEGSDGVERNSPFNNEYVANFLAGREFKVGSRQRNVIFIDTRISVAGGRYFTPVDLEASRETGLEILREKLAFSEQFDNYLRWDLKFGFKLNLTKRKQSHQFYVDIQNLTNRDNVFVRRYNRLTNNVDVINQIGFFPDVGYRFQF